jgi:DNA-binding MarR family transcriptional regulator
VRSNRITYRLARAAYALHAAVEGELHDTLTELDLTLPLADALWHLDPALGPISRRELAERLRCDPSNVTFLVNRLVDRRLIVRARDSGDRRAMSLALTQAGVEVRERLIATIAQSAIFSRLTGSQQRELERLLGRCAGG